MIRPPSKSALLLNNHRLLMANLALNGVNRVAVRRKAVGDRVGSLQFSDDLINTGKSRISPKGAVAVPVTALDAEIPQEWTGVDLLVMDTEGFEVHAIRGAMQTLRRTRYFYVEFSPGELREQGSSSAEFIELSASLFESMYEPAAEPRFFPSKSYIQHLRELTANDVKGRLVRNFLFSNERAPRGRCSLELTWTPPRPFEVDRSREYVIEHAAFTVTGTAVWF